MKSSRTAPSRATTPARVPSSDRAPHRDGGSRPRAPSTSHPDEGPAPRVAGAPSEPSCAAASLEPTGSAPSSLSPSPFTWTDAAHARTWLGAVRETADDLAALAHEGGRRLKHRVLARAELRRQTREAERSLHGLLAEAEAALAPRREG
jgi:hypothetical protein